MSRIRISGPLLCGSVLVCAFAAVAGAQSFSGSVYFAPGGATCCHNTSMTLQFGAGGEAGLRKGFGAGAKVGALGTRSYFGETVMGEVSPNGYYHFIHGSDTEADPFVTAGYTLLFRNGHSNLANFGGGSPTGSSTGWAPGWKYGIS